MELKIKKGTAADIVRLAPAYFPVPLWKCDKNTLMYLQRLAKKSAGSLKVSSIPIVYLTGDLIKKRSTRKYDIYRV